MYDIYNISFPYKKSVKIKSCFILILSKAGRYFFTQILQDHVYILSLVMLRGVRFLMALIVQKFGGATLETTAKVALVASRIREQKLKGDDLVVVVSAMGSTTDNLLTLASELSEEPPLRELDTLLNTGEMVSMALLSISLNAKACPAIGFCGHQAGIQTDQFFSNASIAEINSTRIREAIAAGKVAIIAGFQGQSENGDLTTLGRGGSDTSALALAAVLRADRCEILKDVPAVFTADPKIIKNAFPIRELSYDQFLEMTYWGAKVLQYRSVEIAKYFHVPIYIGPAHSYDLGTLIKENNVIEDSEVIALNSHETVLQVGAPHRSLGEAIKWFRQELDLRKIPFPQLLHSETIDGFIELFFTGPKEAMRSVRSISEAQVGRHAVRELCSITATCRGSTRPETISKVIEALEARDVGVIHMLVSAMSVTMFVEKSLRVLALQLLHGLISPPVLKPQLAALNSMT